jgi:hypothetical protein
MAQGRAGLRPPLLRVSPGSRLGIGGWAGAMRRRSDLTLGPCAEGRFRVASGHSLSAGTSSRSRGCRLRSPADARIALTDSSDPVSEHFLIARAVSSISFRSL